MVICTIWKVLCLIARVYAFEAQTLKWCTTFFKNEKFLKNFHFSIYQNFQVWIFLIWPLLCTSKNSRFLRNRSFWHFDENREKDVKPTSNWPANREFSKIGLKTVFLVRFTLIHEQKFLPKFAPNFRQKRRLGWVLCKAIKVALKKCPNFGHFWQKSQKPVYFTKEKFFRHQKKKCPSFWTSRSNAKWTFSFSPLKMKPSFWAFRSNVKWKMTISPIFASKNHLTTLELAPKPPKWPIFDPFWPKCQIWPLLCTPAIFGHSSPKPAYFTKEISRPPKMAIFAKFLREQM